MESISEIRLLDWLGLNWLFADDFRTLSLKISGDLSNCANDMFIINSVFATVDSTVFDLTNLREALHRIKTVVSVDVIELVTNFLCDTHNITHDIYTGLFSHVSPSLFHTGTTFCRGDGCGHGSGSNKSIECIHTSESYGISRGELL